MIPTQLEIDFAAAAPLVLPRELILASAGSGKTYRISSRIIALLAAGERVDAILASTFTRKAAGEILERVLVRLARAALNEAEAVELADAATLDSGDELHAERPPAATPPAEPAFWNGVLERVVRELHRLNVGTLDAFFIRTARSFAHELALPPTWRIVDEAADRHILSDALQLVLQRTGTPELIELVRGVTKERVGRSVLDALLWQAAALLRLHADLAEGRENSAWQPFDAAFATGPADVRARAAALSERLAALPVPITARGAPNRTWRDALRRSADLIVAREWESLLSEGLCRAATGEAGASFNRVVVPQEVRAAFGEACDLARQALGARYAVQARALGQLARMLAGAVEQRRRETGGYGFEDVTRLIGGPHALAERADLYYRLDMRARHLLLDEFQDTSLPQWEALEPLADELLSGHEAERAAVIVADPKQSIYGWRGASPLLVLRVAERYTLHRALLARSWRSSPVVLNAVNRIFANLERLPVWRGDAADVAAAADWKRAFETHVAQHTELPGYVELRVGPPDEAGGQVGPNLCRSAAELVRDILAAAPGRSIGVLTRTNAAVARIMYELRAVGIEASEEGGVPLIDAAPVAAVLALLRLADHPGDTIARYHVANSPLGEALDCTDHRDRRAAVRLANAIRTRLLEDGYGATLAWLGALVTDACDGRERRRLAQLVELAFRYDEEATLRSSDFVTRVASERVEDATAAQVRVMTVHQAKGLEFDIVVLPQLDTELKGSRSGPFALRADDGAGRVVRVFPYVPQAVRPLFRDLVPELEQAVRQHDAAVLRDSLSGLYVGLTRARYALHMLIRPDGASGRGSAKSAATLLRDALAPDEDANEGDVLFAAGDARWSHRLAELRERPRATVAAGAAAAPVPPPHADRRLAERPAFAAGASPLLRAAAVRSRSLPRRSPSELEGGHHVDLRRIMRIDAAVAALHGTVVHAWFETIAWIEDEPPSPEELRAVARRAAPGVRAEDVRSLEARFRSWLAASATREALSRSRYGGGSVHLERELPFLRREGDLLMEGVIDRLVRFGDGVNARAEILDFKTDAVEPGDDATLAQRVEFYRPQMNAYRRAAAAMYGLASDHVAVRLLFVQAGAVREC